MVSKKSRKQRKDLYNAPTHIRRRRIASTLHPELRVKYNRRTAVVRTGDPVKVMRGGNVGHVGKVLSVSTRKGKISVEKLTAKKADGKETERWIDASNVMIVKLDLSDKWRRKGFGKAAEVEYQEDEEEKEEEE
jgi:large subunit ribosomal protein L24